MTNQKKQWKSITGLVAVYNLINFINYLFKILLKFYFYKKFHLTIRQIINRIKIIMKNSQTNKASVQRLPRNLRLILFFFYSDNHTLPLLDDLFKVFVVKVWTKPTVVDDLERHKQWNNYPPKYAVSSSFFEPKRIRHWLVKFGYLLRFLVCLSSKYSAVPIKSQKLLK